MKSNQPPEATDGATKDGRFVPASEIAAVSAALANDIDRLATVLERGLNDLRALLLPRPV